MSVLYLALSILASTLINLIFRWFKTYKVDKLQAIVINYFVCFLLGFLFSENRNLIQNMESEWFRYCVLLGFLFVAIFLAMAYTTDKISISVNAVSSKMAVVIPVSFAYFFAKEDVNGWFIVGLVLSLISIFLISVKSHIDIPKKYYALPVIVFLGSGIIDTSLKILETAYSQNVQIATLSYSIFLGATLAGTSIYTILNKANFSKINWHNIKAGILLGVPNYFSIWLLLAAIQAFSLKSALVFGINNVGVVLLSTLFSLVIFKEHLSIKNKVGLLLAAISIFIIAYVG
jgi:drug/metabolite transporter (DMT)-like permease